MKISLGTWYFGNNAGKNLKITRPAPNKPFFLTKNLEYAKNYSDYGVYKVTLYKSIENNICNFNNNADLKVLNWPKILIDQINSGNSDLNSIAVEMYNIVFDIKRKRQHKFASFIVHKNIHDWIDVINYFIKKKLTHQFPKSHWEEEKDYYFLLKMWLDIYNNNFDGFIHNEFHSEILALFDIKYLDKISAKKID